jgi:hypothetical protein
MRCWRFLSQIAALWAWWVVAVALPLHLALEPHCHGSTTASAVEVMHEDGSDSDHELPRHSTAERELASVSRLSQAGCGSLDLPSTWSWRDDFRATEMAGARPGNRPVILLRRRVPPESSRGPPSV